MAESPNRSMWAGLAALAVGFLLFLGFLTMSGKDDADGPIEAPGTKQAPRPAGSVPPVLGDRDGPSHKPPVAGDPDAADGTDGSADPAADGGASLDGPVGSVLAIDLATVALEPPPGRPSMVSPQWSPDGKRLLGLSGRTAVPSVWVLEIDHPDRGWLQLEGATEPAWIDANTLAVVKEEQLFSYKLGGKLFSLVDPSDEPGTATQPVAAPDGQKVAYVSTTTANNGDIRVLDRPTSVVRNVTATAAGVSMPAWRPDGGALTGVVDGVVHAWELDSSDALHRFPRAYPARSPGWWGEQTLQWQEGASFAVNLVVAQPPKSPEIVARRALASVERPAPVAGGFVWVGSLADRGTLWAVRTDGSGVSISTDAALASQPDVIERDGTLWVAFTSAEAGTATARIHVGKVNPKTLQVE